MEEDHLNSDLRELIFWRHQRFTYHRFWPAWELGDLLSEVFRGVPDPGVLIGEYFRAMFDGPLPEDEALGVFFSTRAKTTRTDFLGIAGLLCEHLMRQEDLPSEEQRALKVLMAGRFFGNSSTLNREEIVAQSANIARAAAGVRHQYLFM
ncbi:MAG: hypothetical protein EA371_13010 [Gammaproteobacteria bacterium]|nr:MAG: hypothetical protein EA371_13010 [Gammaproteobacteria bacterium]